MKEKRNKLSARLGLDYSVLHNGSKYGHVVNTEPLVKLVNKCLFQLNTPWASGLQGYMEL